jgi:hypothetical protein
MAVFITTVKKFTVQAQEKRSYVEFLSFSTFDNNESKNNGVQRKELIVPTTPSKPFWQTTGNVTFGKESL